MRDSWRYAVWLLVSSFLCLPAAAENPIDYTYVDIEYGADSALEILGDSSDSDNGLALVGSWQWSDRFYLVARHSSNTYDLPFPQSSFDIEFYAAGLGYRHPIRTGQSPVDLVVILTIEHQNTDIITPLAATRLSGEGYGGQAGFRTLVTPQFEVGFFAYYSAYGELPSVPGYLDGLHLILSSAITLSDRFGLVVTYTTGELDYKLLPSFSAPVQVEVDRDDLLMGLRIRF